MEEESCGRLPTEAASTVTAETTSRSKCGPVASISGAATGTCSDVSIQNEAYLRRKQRRGIFYQSLQKLAPGTVATRCMEKLTGHWRILHLVSP
jgi:hypothetical protein